MASSTVPASNGTKTSMPTTDQNIILDYDPTTYQVLVNTSQVNKGQTICFRGARDKVRVVFISPFGTDVMQMADSEPRTLTTGGLYHYRCYFTSDGGQEIQGTTGGILDVQPHRP